MILYCYGTRPEYIKIKKLISLSKDINHKVLYVEQHKELLNFDYDFKIEIEDGENRLNSIISSVISKFKNFSNIKHVLVQGDTATAFAIALAAKNYQMKVIHLEAGLRTYDLENPYPEELYRQLISRIADIHLCPTQLNYNNLINEKTLGEKFVVGNTVLDNITTDEVYYGNTVVITLHRRENHELIKDWFEEIELLAHKYPNYRFILPIHPNPNVYKHKNVFKRVEVIDSVPHDEFIKLIKKCRLIISDSGGIQEEASFLRKKVIVCRKTTERVETIGKTSFLCEKPSELNLLFESLINNCESDFECPFGDGHSSEKVLSLLKNIL
jgi:UDP-N-acetylglucosamine 2-epimerase (non-hydrolysing)